MAYVEDNDGDNMIIVVVMVVVEVILQRLICRVASSRLPEKYQRTLGGR